MGIVLPSADEYAANSKGSDFTLLPSDDYIVEVKEIIVQPNQQDFYNPERVRDTLQVRLKVVSFANGDTLVDENGDDVNDERLLFAFIDPTRVGLVPQPAYARKFFTAAMGSNVEDRLELEDFNDLLGKRLIAVAIIKPNQKGVKKNKVIDFRPIRRRPSRSAAPAADPKAEATAKLSETPDLTEKAKEIFEDDLPF